MGIGTILVGIALLIVVVLLIAIPLLEPRSPAVIPLSSRQILVTERDATIRSIRELDLDYRTGKLNEDDYKRLRETQVRRGAEILREIDALNDQDDIDVEIEAQVTALKDAPAVCPNCASPIDASDQFCAHCGQSLLPQVAVVRGEGIQK